MAGLSTWSHVPSFHQRLIGRRPAVAHHLATEVSNSGHHCIVCSITIGASAHTEPRQKVQGTAPLPMAIFPKVGFREQTSAQAQPIDIDAWTEQTTESLSTVSLSSPQTPRGTTASLAFPLNELHDPKSANAVEDENPSHETPSAFGPRREPLRRDSLKRRDALLKGKEGSRQRRRWENGR